MVIDINNSYNAAAARARAQTNAPAAPALSGPTAEPKTVAGGQDQVVLSEQAQSLGRIQSSIANAPEVNSERVAALKAAIAEGRFEINAERIAENMLNQESLLG